MNLKSLVKKGNNKDLGGDNHNKGQKTVGKKINQ